MRSGLVTSNSLFFNSNLLKIVKMGQTGWQAGERHLLPNLTIWIWCLWNTRGGRGAQTPGHCPLTSAHSPWHRVEKWRRLQNEDFKGDTDPVWSTIPTLLPIFCLLPLLFSWVKGRSSLLWTFPVFCGNSTSHGRIHTAPQWKTREDSRSHEPFCLLHHCGNFIMLYKLQILSCKMIHVISLLWGQIHLSIHLKEYVQ